MKLGQVFENRFSVIFCLPSEYCLYQLVWYQPALMVSHRK